MMPSLRKRFHVIIFTLGLLKAIQKESRSYDRFPRLLQENYHVIDELLSESFKMKFQILQESLFVKLLITT